MKLIELSKNDRARIVKIDADKALKERFVSFGVFKGEELLVKEYALGKMTMEFKIGSTLVAVRADEAEKIEVEKI